MAAGAQKLPEFPAGLATAGGLALQPLAVGAPRSNVLGFELRAQGQWQGTAGQVASAQRFELSRGVGRVVDEHVGHAARHQRQAQGYLAAQGVGALRLDVGRRGHIGITGPGHEAQSRKRQQNGQLPAQPLGQKQAQSGINGVLPGIGQHLSRSNGRGNRNGRSSGRRAWHWVGGRRCADHYSSSRQRVGGRGRAMQGREVAAQAALHVGRQVAGGRQVAQYAAFASPAKLNDLFGAQHSQCRANDYAGRPDAGTGCLLRGDNGRRHPDPAKRQPVEAAAPPALEKLVHGAGRILASEWKITS